MDLLTTTEDAINEMAAAIDRHYGRLDGLLHNASILGTRIPFANSSLNEWRDVMQVNFMAPVMLTRLLLPLVERSEDASVVFTSSSVGNKPRAYWGAYAISKYALEGLALLLADELENTSPIRVNIVNPAATRTAMRAAAYPAEDPGTVKTPDELMPLYLYLLGTDHQGEHGELFDPRTWKARDRWQQTAFITYSRNAPNPGYCPDIWKEQSHERTLAHRASSRSGYLHTHGRP